MDAWRRRTAGAGHRATCAGRTGGWPRFTAAANGLTAEERAVWETELGVDVAPQRASGASAADRFVQGLDRAVRFALQRFDAVVVDLGPVPPVTSTGRPDPRLLWAARAGGKAAAVWGVVMRPARGVLLR